MATEKPRIDKLGTIDCDMVETTPVVWKGRLYRFEYVRERYPANDTGNSYFHFIDVATGQATPAFAAGFHLGSACVEDGAAWAFGVPAWGAPTIHVFRSDDLKHWTSRVALDLPGWGIYNTSVCRGPDRYVMAFEIGEPPEETGVPYTMRFAKSTNLQDWVLTPASHVYTKDRYSACPALRFLDSWYYMIYLEAYPGPQYGPHIVRTKDFIAWETSPHNPVLWFSDEDKKIANPQLTDAQRQHVAGAVNLNNSDVDLCEHDGRTVIYYSWGDQLGTEFLAEARYDGPLDQFLRAWFPA